MLDERTRKLLDDMKGNTSLIKEPTNDYEFLEAVVEALRQARRSWTKSFDLSYIIINQEDKCIDMVVYENGKKAKQPRTEGYTLFVTPEGEMNAREILKEYGISSEVRTMKSMTNLGLMRDGYYSMKLNLSFDTMTKGLSFVYTLKVNLWNYKKAKKILILEKDRYICK